MHRSDRGSVLVLALWTIGMLTVFAISLGFGARQKAEMLARVDAMAALSAIGQSGIETMKALIKTDIDKDFDTPREEWSGRGLEEVKVAGGSFALISRGWDASSKKIVDRPGVVDEARKINLNTSDAETIMRLLISVGELDKDSAEELAYNIVDWRDPDPGTQHPQYGAESDYYESLGTPYKAKDMPMESLDELLLVKSMTRELFDKISPYVTVYGNGAVNVNTAPAEALSAMGLSEGTVAKILHHRDGPDGKFNTPDDRYFMLATAITRDLDLDSPPLDGAERTAIGNLVSAEKLSTASSFFSVNCRARSERGAEMDVEAVMDRGGRVVYSRFSEVQWPSRS